MRHPSSARIGPGADGARHWRGRCRAAGRLVLPKAMAGGRWLKSGARAGRLAVGAARLRHGTADRGLN